jgi:hypothetical protein
VKYKLCPGNEFSEGNWNLSVISCSYSNLDSTQINKELFSVSCNQVRGQKYSAHHEVQSFNQPLCTVLIDHKIKTKVTYFDKLWFHINAVSNELEFTFTNESNERFNYDCDIFLQVIFQRIN